MAKIPKLKSNEKIREFWDNNSLSNFEEELKPAGILFQKPRKEVLSVRLDPPFLAPLKAIAKSVGIGYSSLARMWIIERIKKELRGVKTSHRHA